MKKKYKKGNLIWITGLSGSGKTYIGKRLKKELEKKYGTFFLISGDDLRSIFKLKRYDRESRLIYAESYSKLCKRLTDQGINVIITVGALFNKIRAWNKRNIKNYYEIFIKRPIKEIIKINKKKLHSKIVKIVFGKDIKAEYPKNPDLIILNNSKKDVDTHVKQILKKYRFYT